MIKVVKRYCFFALIFILGSGYLEAASNRELLVAVNSVNPNIKIDASLRSGKSGIPRCYLRKTVALHLDLVEQELEQLGFGLKIMDAYRPLAVQKKLWKEFPDNRYVANPIHGSRHNRGAAVDLRLIRLHDGKELSMPTTKFSKECHRNYARMQNEEMKKNCKLLELVMEKHGFLPLATEWWHFDYKNWRAYEVLDVSFEELACCKQNGTSQEKLLQTKSLKKVSKIKKVVKKRKIKKNVVRKKGKKQQQHNGKKQAPVVHPAEETSILMT